SRKPSPHESTAPPTPSCEDGRVSDPQHPVPPAPHPTAPHPTAPHPTAPPVAPYSGPYAAPYLPPVHPQYAASVAPPERRSNTLGIVAVIAAGLAAITPILAALA